MGKLLEMRGIKKSFFEVKALKGVDFDLEHGEVHVLLGENGAGKSTLIKILSGAYSLDEGSITLDGQKLDSAGFGPTIAEARGIVTIYQNFHLIPHLSVAENLSLPDYKGSKALIRWSGVSKRANEVIGELGFDLDPGTLVKDLSVAKKQMLEIAIALSKNAKILIMDEPTAALSEKEVDILFATIAKVKAAGIGIIYISHKLEEIVRIGDRVTVLRDGASIATVDPKTTKTEDLIALMVGRVMSTRGARVSWASGERMFEVRGLKNRNFPEPIDLYVLRNEILGVTGLVGSSKTELARAMFGIDRCTSGETLLDGASVHIRSPRSAVEFGIGYLPEDRDACGLCLNMGVKENMTLVFLSKMHSLFFNRAGERRSVQEIVDSIRVRTPGLSQQVKYLSGGNKQKVVLGKWLMGNCRLLILDEPTIGIDVGARSEIYELIRGFAKDEGKAVIFISSDMDEIQEISSRILVMSNGQIVANLDPGETSKQQIMHYSLGARQG
ncbi:MAG: sugar ABC transporter ATP-binding protein [Rectinemataceae bacterium]|jgi:ribose transport system ATP-binding protein